MECSYGLMSTSRIENPISTTVWINLPFKPGCHYVAFADEATAYTQCFYQHVCTYNDSTVKQTYFE